LGIVYLKAATVQQAILFVANRLYKKLFSRRNPRLVRKKTLIVKPSLTGTDPINDKKDKKRKPNLGYWLPAKESKPSANLLFPGG
jgi:hypothetical protein